MIAVATVPVAVVAAVVMTMMKMIVVATVLVAEAVAVMMTTMKTMIVAAVGAAIKNAMNMGALPAKPSALIAFNNGQRFFSLNYY